MTEIKLPTLPPGHPTYEFPDGAYDAEQMQDYARADRKRFAETLSALSGDAAGMYEQECDSYFNGLSDGYDYAAQMLRGEGKSAAADGFRKNEADAARYRTLRSMPPGIRVQVHVGEGEWEDVCSGDELDRIVRNVMDAP